MRLCATTYSHISANNFKTKNVDLHFTVTQQITQTGLDIDSKMLHPRRSSALLLSSPHLSGDTATQIQQSMYGLTCPCSTPLSTQTARPASTAAGRGIS
ncbi:hypothetical protein PO909_014786 [Leuciscus waleckii]